MGLEKGERVRLEGFFGARKGGRSTGIVMAFAPYRDCTARAEEVGGLGPESWHVEPVRLGVV